MTKIQMTESYHLEHWRIRVLVIVSCFGFRISDLEFLSSNLQGKN